MNWKTLLLLAVAIALIASGIVLYTMDKPVPVKAPRLTTPVYDLDYALPSKPPLYAQLWFVPLIAGVAILSFLGGRKFKL